MKLIFSCLFCLFTFAFVSAQNVAAIHDTIIKTYFKSGELKSSIPYINGVPNGKAKWYLKNGLVSYEIEYKDTLLLNEFIYSYFKNGNLKTKFSKPQSTWIKDKDFYTGYDTWYYSNGNIKEEGITLMQNGSDGLWKYYYSNGKLKKEGTWNRFRKTGTWKFYDINGNLLREKNKRN